MLGTRVELSVFDLDIGARDYQNCLSMLSPVERERASAFKFDRDRRRWCVSRAGLRRTLGGLLHTAECDLRLASDALGKPYLPDYPQYYFNMSHADGVAVVAVTTLAAIGIDVERVRDIANRDSVVEQFFSAREIARFLALPESERSLAFYLGWTRKEAVIKATGEGLRADLAAFAVSLEPGAPVQVLEDRRAGATATPWHLWHWAPRLEYVAAVALQTDRAPAFVAQEARDVWSG